MFRTRKVKILSGAGLAVAALATVLVGPPAQAAITGDNFILPFNLSVLFLLGACRLAC
jgi:hypothetical protein